MAEFSGDLFTFALGAAEAYRISLDREGAAPRFRALGFPRDRPAHPPRRADHTVDDIGAVDALGNGLDVVEGKCTLEEFLQLKLQYLSLRLL